VVGDGFESKNSGALVTAHLLTTALPNPCKTDSGSVYGYKTQLVSVKGQHHLDAAEIQW